VGSLRWHKNGQELGFSLNNARGPGDVYSLDVATGKVERWTTSETAVRRMFSGSEASAMEKVSREDDFGILVQATGEVSPGSGRCWWTIHGGPEGQSQPRFLGRSNYLLNELGIALIYPNVRGSNRVRQDVLAAGQRI